MAPAVGTAVGVCSVKTEKVCFASRISVDARRHGNGSNSSKDRTTETTETTETTAIPVTRLVVVVVRANFLQRSHTDYWLVKECGTQSSKFGGYLLFCNYVVKHQKKIPLCTRVRFIKPCRLATKPNTNAAVERPPGNNTLTTGRSAVHVIVFGHFTRQKRGANNMQRTIRFSILTLTLASIFFTIASATITILYPGGKYYAVADSNLTIRWSSSDPIKDPQSFSIYIKNDKIRLNPHAIANNVNTQQLQTTVLFLQDFLKLGDATDGFVLQFTAIDNINNVYAVSEPFEVKPNGTAPAEYDENNASSSNGNDSSGNSSASEKGDSSTLNGVSVGATLATAALIAFASVLI